MAAPAVFGTLGSVVIRALIHVFSGVLRTLPLSISVCPIYPSACMFAPGAGCFPLPLFGPGNRPADRVFHASVQDLIFIRRQGHFQSGQSTDCLHLLSIVVTAYFVRHATGGLP